MFVAEEWPEDRRRVGAGLMHTGYYVGIFLAALANFGMGQPLRLACPCLSSGRAAGTASGRVRHGVTEPATWTKKEKVVRAWAVWHPFVILFSPALRRRTIVNALLMLASIPGLWAGTVYVPAAIMAVAEAGGHGGAQAAQLASWGITLVSFATILGCLAMPSLAERLGRRGALAVFFTLMMVFIALTFGKVFYLGAVALPWFFVCLFSLGLGGANFSVYTLWLPEQYPYGMPGQRIRQVPPRLPDRRR